MPKTAFSLPHETCSHLPTLEGWKAELTWDFVFGNDSFRYRCRHRQR